MKPTLTILLTAILFWGCAEKPKCKLCELPSKPGTIKINESNNVIDTSLRYGSLVKVVDDTTKQNSIHYKGTIYSGMSMAEVIEIEEIDAEAERVEKRKEFEKTYGKLIEQYVLRAIAKSKRLDSKRWSATIDTAILSDSTKYND